MDGLSNYLMRMSLPLNTSNHQIVMTEAQLETLRRQICVYSTICSQLVEMHKIMSQQAASSRDHLLFDPVMGGQTFRPSARQRWTPSQSQIDILDRVYEASNGNPNKQKIKDITAELSQHGPVSETNVYNWFQNRKARAKRKQQPLPRKEGDSEVDTDGESSKEKKLRLETESKREEVEYGERNSASHDINQGSHDINQCSRDTAPGCMKTKSQLHDVDYDMGILGLRYKGISMDTSQQWNNYPTEKKDFCHIQENVPASLIVLNKADLKGDSLGSVAVNGSNSDQYASGRTTVVIDGDRLEVPSGVVDVRRMFGETAVLAGFCWASCSNE
uniref:HD transcription factor n=2 Tax=Gnetum gnemon TaxID=3382 RepID=S6D6M3_GNEGN|nr:HD transcription factor [Gnetum gnemon]